MNYFSRVMDAVYLGCIWVSGIALLVMTIAIPIGIFCRYVLGVGAAWPEPVAVLCMVIFTFLGAAASYRAGAHIAVTMLTDRLSPPLQRAFGVAVDLLLAGLSVFVLLYGTTLCRELWAQPVAEFPVLTAGNQYLPLPLGAAVTLLFIVEKLLAGSQSRRPLVLIGNPSAHTDPAH
jgi:TRAP-type C4-dicarboxylate transport system permease small subunit